VEKRRAFHLFLSAPAKRVEATPAADCAAYYTPSPMESGDSMSPENRHTSQQQDSSAITAEGVPEFLAQWVYQAPKRLTLGPFALTWRRGSVEVVTVPGLGFNGVRSALPGVIDRSAMHFQSWGPPAAEAAAGLTAAQQRERTVRFDAIGVGGRVRWLTSRDGLLQRIRR